MQQPNQPLDLLDIIFRHRNREYGAYILRKYYPQRLLKAILLTGLLVFLLILLIRTGGSNRIQVKPQVPVPGIEITPVEFEKEKLEKKNKAGGSRYNMATSRIMIEKDVSPADMVPGETGGDTDADGKEGEGSGLEIGGGSTRESISPGTEIIPEKPVEKKPSFGPSFPGGKNGWTKFLQRHLRVPDQLMPGQQVTVIVKFWISEEGSISRFQVLQSGGEEFDREVSRLLKRSPRWKPAVQEGIPVESSFLQPVTFIGEEQ